MCFIFCSFSVQFVSNMHEYLNFWQVNREKNIEITKRTQAVIRQKALLALFTYGTRLACEWKMSHAKRKVKTVPYGILIDIAKAMNAISQKPTHFL